MGKEQAVFEQYWKPVEGMGDVQSLMIEFANMASDELVKQVHEGKGMIITSFTNGGLNPLIYVFAELKKRTCEGQISDETFQAIADHIALFETKSTGKPFAKKKGIITSQKYKFNREQGDEAWQNPESIVMIDDIVEGSSTCQLLDEVFPDVPKTYIVPVIKHCTHKNMVGNPHTLLYTQELNDDWDDSGCGMNGGIFFKDLPIEKNYEVEVLQRYSNTGYYHDPKENEQIADLGETHMHHMMERQLPWMHLHDMHQDLALLEELKNYRDHEKQLYHAEMIIERAKNFTYDEALSILTASY